MWCVLTPPIWLAHELGGSGQGVCGPENGPLGISSCCHLPKALCVRPELGPNLGLWTHYSFLLGMTREMDGTWGWGRGWLPRAHIQKYSPLSHITQGTVVQ